MHVVHRYYTANILAPRDWYRFLRSEVIFIPFPHNLSLPLIEYAILSPKVTYGVIQIIKLHGSTLGMAFSYEMRNYVLSSVSPVATNLAVVISAVALIRNEVIIT